MSTPLEVKISTPHIRYSRANTACAFLLSLAQVFPRLLTGSIGLSTKQIYPKTGVKSASFKFWNACSVKLRGILFGVILIFSLLIFNLLPSEAGATEYTSANYKVLDPVIDIAAGPRAVSTDFVDLTAVGQTAIGRSSSPNYRVCSGFLCFLEALIFPPAPVCGDGTCNGTETCGTCSADCGVCAAPPQGGGPMSPPITYFPPFLPPFVIVPPIITPPIIFPPVVPQGCVPGENGISRSDLNCDGRVNLTDFSVMLYYLPRAYKESALADINRDKTVNLTDVSVMFSDWTEKLVKFEDNGFYKFAAETGRGVLDKFVSLDAFGRGRQIFDKFNALAGSLKSVVSRYSQGAAVALGENLPRGIGVKAFVIIIVIGGVVVFGVIKRFKKTGR